MSIEPISKRRSAKHIVLRSVIVGLIGAIVAFCCLPEPASFERYLRLLHTEQLAGGPSYSAMVGDSITANGPHLMVCGKPVLRAAFNGARVQALVDHVVPTLREKPPSALLLAAGVNDTWRHIPTPRPQRVAEFRAAYSSLIGAAQALTPQVGVVLIGPVAERGDLSATFFDTDLIREFNLIIEELAAKAAVPTFTLAALAGADGFARDGLMLDGVHPSAAGYAIWTTAVEQAWTRVKLCG
jgi:lysophospholipase L1-like esterase